MSFTGLFGKCKQINYVLVISCIIYGPEFYKTADFHWNTIHSLIQIINTCTIDEFTELYK